MQRTWRSSEPAGALVAELRQDGEDLVVFGGLDFGELVLRQLNYAVFVDFRLPLGHLVNGRFTLFNQLFRPRAGAVILPDCGCGPRCPSSTGGAATAGGWMLSIPSTTPATPATATLVFLTRTSQ